MRKGKYSDEQVIAILREQEAGRPTAEICRKYGVSNATFYKWKSKFGGMQVSDAKRAIRAACAAHFAPSLASMRRTTARPSAEAAPSTPYAPPRITSLCNARCGRRFFP
jgi:transposase-like protein